MHISHFVKKEFVETIVGPKFLITLGICTILILTSLYTGYELFQSEREWFARAKSENMRALEYSGSYANLKNRGTKSLREPSAMSIFVKGVDSSVGRAAMVNEDPDVVLRDSRFGLNPIFAVFGELDLAFIVKVILSLFAILFSYNAISGERELGTLKHVMSYPVSRASFIIGKTFGGLITLLMTLILPLLLGLLLLLSLPGVDLGADDWGRIGGMVLVFCCYLAVFYMIGMAMSSLTRNSFVSFLFGLFIWVVSIVILPKGAVELAGQISPAPSLDTIEAERASLTREYNNNLEKLTMEYFKENYDGNRQNFGTVFSEAFKHGQERAKGIRDEKIRPMLQRYRREQFSLLRTAESISRLSPTACVTLAVNRLAGTDVEVRERFIERLENYKQAFLAYSDEMIEKYPEKSQGGISVSATENGVDVKVPVHDIELPGFPEFQMEKEQLETTLAGIVPDIGILSVYLVLLFAGAFVAFVRYDVR